MTKKAIFELEVKNERESELISKKIVRYFHVGDAVLLFGDLGSGKTFFVRAFVKALGLKAEVSSPTFTIINQYTGPVNVNHLDLYRIESQRELQNLGLNDILNMDSINFIEWPEQIADRIDWPHFRMYIEMNSAQPGWRKVNLYKYD